MVSSAELAGHVEAVDEVRRLAAGAERERHVAGPGQQSELVGEDLGEVAVVGDGGEQRGVGCVSASAGSGRRFSTIGWQNSTATCCASVAPPPLPMTYRRPPRSNAAAIARASASMRSASARKNCSLTSALSRALRRMASFIGAATGSLTMPAVRRKYAAQAPSADTMVAPSGCAGVHRLPNAGQSCGFLRPRRIWPLMHSAGSWVSSAPTSKRRSAS